MDAIKWANDAANKLVAEFGSRLVFTGIQSSRARGEARNNSDIDLLLHWSEGILAY